MVGPLSNASAQNTTVNPFQQQISNEAKSPSATQKAEENRTQPQKAESAGVQKSENDTQQEDRAVQQAKSGNDNGSSVRGASGNGGSDRGSMVDITV